VGPQCSPRDDEARRYAKHAWHVLDQARTFATVSEALADLDMAVGTASDLALNEKRDYERIAMRVRDFAERAAEMKGTIGLLFGPEDDGLTNEFMARILEHLELPEHRRRTTLLTFRKVLGRAMLSRWEYHRLMGVFNGALRAMEEVQRQGKTVRGLRRVHDQPGRKRPAPREEPVRPRERPRR
jgi:tRNA C32,U32 (ribose-2'-O)-methylase TrmJ